MKSKICVLFYLRTDYYFGRASISYFSWQRCYNIDQYKCNLWSLTSIFYIKQYYSWLFSKQKLNDDGSYNYRYDSTNGISIQEAGVGGIANTGAIQWLSPEGILIQTSYTADANGYRAEGAHIPTPPPIPDYIIESIRFNRKEEEKRAHKKILNN